MTKRYFDNLIVGAGISGISAAYHIKTKASHRSFAVLERRSSVGGTWDLFRYPGIRSDSDMFTLGFRFRPWQRDQAIATGPDILSYISETVDACDLRASIAFNKTVLSANYTSDRAIWSVEVLDTQTQARETWECNFLHGCTGYYSYDEAHDPIRNMALAYKGHLVHPQFWPDDLDYAGKKVVVIGSGATAISLVPALAKHAAHVTMLQRSPSFVFSSPAHDVLTRRLSAIFPKKLTYRLARTRSALFYALSYSVIRKTPELTRRWLQKSVEKRLGRAAVEEHFSPAYKPWDQRICLLPDGDLFDAIGNGQASVVTGTINGFTQNGISLASGKHIDADIVVTATGLKLNFLGDAALYVDGKRVRAEDLVSYKGVMFAGLPNLAITFGYTNSSWTLKADLVSDYVARLMNIMARKGAREVVPVLDDPDIATNSYFQLESGYVRRAARDLPRQGERAPWTVSQNYYWDLLQLSWSRIADSVLRFR